MMPPTCFLIVGPARSGTSITAAICQKLGVILPGDSIGPHPDLNPLGHFESRAWHTLNRHVRDNGAAHQGGPSQGDVDAYDELIRRDTVVPVWGVKDPALCHTLRWVLPRVYEAGSRAAIIACHRPFRPTAASRARHSAFGEGASYSRQEAESRQLAERSAFYESLARADRAGVAIHHVDYDQLIDNTFREVDRIAEFVWGDRYRAEDVAAAAELVDPSLRHYQSRQVLPAVMPAAKPVRPAPRGEWING